MTLLDPANIDAVEAENDSKVISPRLSMRELATSSPRIAWKISEQCDDQLSDLNRP